MLLRELHQIKDQRAAEWFSSDKVDFLNAKPSEVMEDICCRLERRQLTLVFLCATEGAVIIAFRGEVPVGRFHLNYGLIADRWVVPPLC